jgi:hypothetical protein
MSKPFRPLRSRVVRLLASVLVVVTLVGNGLALGQLSAALAKKDCCDQMTGHKVATSTCDEQGGKPCPTPGPGCDDQCLSRAQPNVVLPAFALDLPYSEHASSLLTTLSISDRPLADPGPGLRPPISS